VRLVKEQLDAKNVSVKHFKNCQISALAAMKILKHALVGVETGRKANGLSLEVMGFLVGKPEGDTIIVFDTIPSPVVGFENKVEVSDKGLGYIITCAEQLEKKRPERIIGWYHSHPFDVDTHSMCFLSSTDTQTQTMQQMNVKAFTAIVVDPLRSLAKQEPEMQAFRTFPPNHKLANPEECPDGGFMDKDAKLQRWGVSADRYYQLKSSYFMSSLARSSLDVMSRNNLWVRVLASSSIMESDNRQRFAERMRKAADKLSVQASQSAMGGAASRAFYGPIGGGAGKKQGRDELAQATQACADLAIEQCKGHASQISKDLLFNFLKSQEKRDSDRAARATA